jgi:hypothetical protein
VADEREHRRGDHARVRAGGAAQEAAQGHDPAGWGRWRDPGLVKRNFPAARTGDVSILSTMDAAGASGVTRSYRPQSISKLFWNFIASILLPA